MMSKIRHGHTTKRSIQLLVPQDMGLLDIIPRVEMRPDHPGLKFWPLAQAIFKENPELGRIEVSKTQTGDFAITAAGTMNSAIDFTNDATREKVTKSLVRGINNNAQYGVQERKLIDALGGDKLIEPKGFGVIVQNFIRDTFVPFLRKPEDQGGIGHDNADLGFVDIRNLPNPKNQNGPVQSVVGLVLKGGCTSCPASELATIRNFTLMMHPVFNANAGGKAEISGVDVVPSSGGSPCYTMRYSRHIIEAGLKTGPKR